MSKRTPPKSDDFYEQPGGDPSTPLAACCKNKTHKDRSPKIKEAQR